MVLEALSVSTLFCYHDQTIKFRCKNSYQLTIESLSRTYQNTCQFTNQLNSWNYKANEELILKNKLNSWNQQRNKELILSIPKSSRIVSNTTCPPVLKRLPLKNKSNMPVTGLITFPGSGNTWTRHLIQISTGM